MADPNDAEICDEDDDDDDDSRDDNSGSDDAIYEFEENFMKVDPSDESAGDGSESGES